jgi:hypothetical protein
MHGSRERTHALPCNIALVCRGRPIQCAATSLNRRITPRESRLDRPIPSGIMPQPFEFLIPHIVEVQKGINE